MGKTSPNSAASIAWFREASPYIHAHRGKKMVLCLPGSMVAAERIDTLVSDLILLSHLGLQLVLCFGLRSELDAHLTSSNQSASVVDDRRITTDAALVGLLQAAGDMRARLEAQLSRGLPNTPMSGTHLSVCSGNFISAQPYGIHNGVDYLHTGTVRQVNAHSINSLLESGQLVVLPPIGYSPTGDVFNVKTEEIASEAAIALNADKLVFFVDQLPIDETGALIRQASSSEMEAAALQHGNIDIVSTLNYSVQSCKRGVARVHLVVSNKPDALLKELFTRDGGGTLVTAGLWESIRQAQIQDVGGIIKLIEPLQQDGSLVARSREQLELDIDNFMVCERDGMIVACAALFIPDEDTDGYAQIACVATHEDYQGAGRADKLLLALEKRARTAGITRVLLLSTRAAHWFIQRGFNEVDLQTLPAGRQALYNAQRNSKVFEKLLA
ncbi:MAG: amino-acid N-acetyltransferase [Granulosicoccaceae bacterium]